MAVQDRQKLYAELFGDYSSSESENECESVDSDTSKNNDLPPLTNLLTKYTPEYIDGLILGSAQTIEMPAPGFVIHRNVLDTPTQHTLFEYLSSKYFQNTPKFDPSSIDPRINQGMHFGTLDNQPFEILQNICLRHPSLLPPNIRTRKILFDQAIINLYDPGEGICDHVDLLRYEDGIVGFSFGSPAVLRLRPVDSEDTERTSSHATELGNRGLREVLTVVYPGDLYAMSGEGRYQWTHGFPSGIQDPLSGKDVHTSRRISVTLRKLIH